MQGMGNKQPQRKQLFLRTRVLMAERGIRTATELLKLLVGIGVKISLPQLGRIIDGKTPHLDKAVLEGMMTVLDCGVADLFEVR
jgi:DNA-binding Xre family transcriptional regulator